MALTANPQGVVTGQFTIPANVSAGSKRVEFKGSGGSHASASFFGQGTFVENVMQKVVNSTTRYYDPLAQTFYLDSLRQVAGLDLYVEAKGTTPIVVHIRETSNGYPAQTILAEASLHPSGITAGAWNRWLFQTPVTLLPNVEYCIVVMCDDAVSSIGIAELGKWSLSSQRWVTSQASNVGVLFSSSNNSTWTAHQDRDMTFRLLAAKYTQAQRVVDLGTVAASGHTDALVLSAPDTPTSETTFSIDLELPDGTVITTGDSQKVTFIPAVTGNIGVKARLSASEHVSTTVFPGTVLALGTVQTTADYVSRAFPAGAPDSDVMVIFDAYLPSGSTVAVSLSGTGAGDTWETIPQDGVALPIGDGLYEYRFKKVDFNKANCKIKLVLNGTNAARPIVRNLRASVT
ncbi:hypothetical protein FHR70_000766 [Microvirga lupini]|uniref:Uncharacterized protein n=1 Tax=Microvirga lupini TaxID=420324 RepID=A0A7W4VIA4_9HYPH|nr:hypothetical protein [Microvirga lupini]MBB3017726.1 hypothetical protein [Microvirga lupini]